MKNPVSNTQYLGWTVQIYKREQVSPPPPQPFSSLPVFSLISQSTLKRAGFIRWQFNACFLLNTNDTNALEHSLQTILCQHLHRATWTARNNYKLLLSCTAIWSCQIKDSPQICWGHTETVHLLFSLVCKRYIWYKQALPVVPYWPLI